MKFLQKLGKALMLPVACLPICGILMGIGYALCPATMQGGDITGYWKPDRILPCKGRRSIDRSTWHYCLLSVSVLVWQKNMTERVAWQL